MHAIRQYDADTDTDEAKRIWRECGWFIKGDDQDRRDFLGDAPSFVMEHGGRVQSLAVGRWGHQRHGDEELRIGLVAGVGTGIAARRRGLAGRVTARLVSELAAQGAEAVVRGTDPSLPVLRASVAALSRLWLGAESPEVLSLTDDLHGPPELLAALSRATPRRRPALDWDL